MRRVEWHIRGAGLENRQQPDQRVETAPGDDCHPVIRAHTEIEQMMSECVGALIELGIGQAFPLLNRRQRLRPLQRLSLDSLLNRGHARVVHPRRIPLLQQRDFFRRAQAERRYRQVHRLQSLFQDQQPAFGQHLDFIGTEIRLAINQVQTRVVVGQITQQVHRQRRRLFHVRDLGDPRQRLAVAVIVGVLLVGNGQFEQLRAVLPQQAQGTVHLAQGEALMAEILFQFITDCPDQLTEGLFTAKAHAHRADLREQPEGGFEPCTGTVEDRQPHHPFVTLRGAAEVHVQRCQQHMERRGSKLPGHLLHALVQQCRQGLRKNLRLRISTGQTLLMARQQQRLGQLSVFVQPVGTVQRITGRAVIARIVFDEVNVRRRRSRCGLTVRQGVIDLVQ
ncbi:hypothetical protein PseAD21_19135 [Pseudomonas sp. AD21]|nr:hypothetical protein PseAD21_19135 [Pseudomonas sp. AD21]